MKTKFIDFRISAEHEIRFIRYVRIPCIRNSETNNV